MSNVVRHGVAALAAAFCVTANAAAQPVLELMPLPDGPAPAALETRLTEIIAQAEPDGRSSQAVTARRLLAVLRSEGFYGASVRPIARDGSTVFWVTPGSQFVIGAVELVDAGADSDAMSVARAASGLESGAPLSAEAVIAGEARALAALQEAGWPEAEADERSVTIDHATAQGRIELRYEAGAFSRLGEVRTTEPAWRPEYIARLAPPHPGPVAQVSALRDYQARLTALDSVASARVRLSDLRAGSEERDMLVELTAAPRNQVELGFGLSTSEGGGVGGTWTQRNLFGGDESGTLTGRLLTLEQSLAVELSAPHWRRRDDTLTLIAEIRAEDTDAFDQTAIELETDLTRRLNRIWSAGVRMGLDASQLRFGGTDFNTLTASAGLSVVYDTRDSATDPSRGAQIAVSATPAMIFGDLESTYVLSEATARSYLKVSDELTAAGRLRVGGLLGATIASIPPDERFYAGGGGSVRGFEYQSLGPQTDDGRPTGGRSVLEASAELRWRRQSRWGAALIADAGIASDDTSPDLSDLRVGLGVGLRYHFDFAPLRVDLVAPVDRRSDEASLHLYVGLGQAF